MADWKLSAGIGVDPASKRLNAPRLTPSPSMEASVSTGPGPSYLWRTRAIAPGREEVLCDLKQKT